MMWTPGLEAGLLKCLAAMESSLSWWVQGEESRCYPSPCAGLWAAVLPEGWILGTTPLEALLEVDTSCLSQTLLAFLSGAVPRCALDSGQRRERMDSHNLRKHQA